VVGCMQWLGIALVGLVLVQPRLGLADDGPAEPGESAASAPWAEGVSAEQMAAAQTSLEKGNQLFLDAQYQEALEAYTTAIQSWDHPAIRFNVVRVLIKLGRSVEAYENLELALKYDDAPLEPLVYAEATTYQQLLLGQLAEVEVSCTEPGAEVSLDGRALLRCPGAVVQRLVPGPHQVVAKKPRFLTVASEDVLLPGKKTQIAIQMIPLTDAAVSVRRWRAWKPWAVVGGGAVVAGVGGLLQLKASRDFDAFDAEVDRACSNSGCPPSGEGQLSQSTLNLESRAKLENRVAVGMMITGGAAVGAGLVLLWMNRAQTFTPTEDSQTQPPPAQPAVLVAPVVSPDQVSLDLALRF